MRPAGSVIEVAPNRPKTTRVFFDENPTLSYFLVEEYNPTQCTKEHMDERCSKRKLNFTPCSVPIFINDDQWASYNWKKNLTKIVAHSKNRQLRTKASMLGCLTLGGRFLHVDDMSKDWRQFWLLIGEFVCELVKELSNPLRILSDDTVDDKQAKHHDITILERDRSIHGVIDHIRLVIRAIGHFLGQDDFRDDAQKRTVLLSQQIKWYENNILKA